ncbi:MAG: HAD family hydrolase [Verrucomicrobia bacterium]|nr:HAD family hydrolase [Verrucomicrobiota bacterium]
MNLRAVICDIYGTVLDVGPPPDAAEARWFALWREMLGRAPRLTLAEFGAGCEAVVAREHAAARAAGIAFPEVYWPEVVRAVVFEVAALDAAGQAEFAFRQTALWHTVQLMPGAAAALRGLRERGILLGIASNAQPYTLRELEEALAGAGASSAWFEPALCFWSFAHGFGKPSPHVIRLLTARLRATDVAPHETLMVGDRVDNDLAPARAQGWRTWRLGAGDGRDGGDWAQLAAALAVK